MLPNNEAVVRHKLNKDPKECEKVERWNGYHCKGLNYSVLRFVDEAWTARARMNIPVSIVRFIGKE